MSYKSVDFDVAMALVDYVQRPSARVGDWGLTDATSVRTKLCELRSRQNTVRLSVINAWLSDQVSGQMALGSSRRLHHLKPLMRRAAAFNTIDEENNVEKYDLFEGLRGLTYYNPDAGEVY